MFSTRNPSDLWRASFPTDSSKLLFPLPFSRVFGKMWVDLLHFDFMMLDITSSKGIINRQIDKQAQQHQQSRLEIKGTVSKTKTLQPLVDGPLKLQDYLKEILPGIRSWLKRERRLLEIIRNIMRVLELKGVQWDYAKTFRELSLIYISDH